MDIQIKHGEHRLCLHQYQALFLPIGKGVLHLCFAEGHIARKCGQRPRARALLALHQAVEIRLDRALRRCGHKFAKKDIFNNGAVVAVRRLLV